MSRLNYELYTFCDEWGMIMGQAKTRGTFEERKKEGIAKKQQAEKERIERRRNMPKPSHKTYALMAMMAGLGIGV